MNAKSRKAWMRQLTKLMLIMCILLISVNIGANETDPCTVYGTVKDENKMAVAGVIITVENLNTKEMNRDGKDTITGSPIPVTTDSDGVYTFELINLKSGYNDGDEILVTAEKDGIIGSESTFVRAGSWGAGVDISLEIEQNQEKEPWYISLFDTWMLIFLLIVIIAVISTALLFKKRKGAKTKAKQIEGALVGRKDRKKVAGEKLDKQSIETEEVVVYECPECDEEIKEEDTNCPKCGVKFAETWNLSTPIPT